jgi:transcriptional regulator with XRE-family HTH domain
MLFLDMDKSYKDNVKLLSALITLTKVSLRELSKGLKITPKEIRTTITTGIGNTLDSHHVRLLIINLMSYAPEITGMTFGEYIKFYRGYQQLSQSDLAKLVGVGREYISLIENDKIQFSKIKEEVLDRLSNVLKIDISTYIRKYIMKKVVTQRGYSAIEFIDQHDKLCTIQKSSLGTEDAIWFGINDAEPKILSSKIIDGGTGWAKYPIPEDVKINTRMHLTREQVRELLPILQKFVDIGKI